ncbi:L-amino acid N-acyltransferase YncA [Pacificibacter maritimus]|uniref:L-amino acid N-acyltransferase YncA n=1 Tax=Pacificibacter maritimus TaxID=762213 RepID=A0A3N4U2M1_9RHOB|nr:GNAT family N-acetyltransferase [Pacificibacter maritimus]RPE64742.1 L-amino acid N-acyltransferase YncA [Pacificibacter maritimus]
MNLHIRKAGRLDARSLSTFLNDTIGLSNISPDEIIERMRLDGSAWLLAEDAGGRILGVQWIENNPEFLGDVADISSFIAQDEKGLSIGSQLFKATCDTARNLGYQALDAIIRADNERGITYYQSRGFEQIKRLENVPLEGGTYADKIWKRYALKR